MDRTQIYRVMSESKSLTFYDDSTRAERYHRKKGFAPARKERMLKVTIDLLTTLTSPQSTVLELGAGTGLFTEKLLNANHFQEIYVTDGADAMLTIARKTLKSKQTLLHFVQLDFTTSWSNRFADTGIDAVVSSMAIHHADEKQQLFQQVFAVLKPRGVFVFADHMAGTSACTQYLITRERALIKLGQEGRKSPEQILELMREDEERQRAEGNMCETVAQYQQYLATSGFEDIDCLWRDYWLAVFVARKPKD